MGCTPFRDHWDKSADDLLMNSVRDCLAEVPGTGLADVDGFPVSSPRLRDVRPDAGQTVAAGRQASHPGGKYCATGSEAFRNAAFAVASGAYNLVMATGVEKLKDSAYSGLTATWPAV